MSEILERIRDDGEWIKLSFTPAKTITDPLLKLAKEVVVTNKGFTYEVWILPTVLNNPGAGWAEGTTGYFNYGMHVAEVNGTSYSSKCIYQWQKSSGKLVTRPQLLQYSGWTEAMCYPDDISVRL